MANLEKLRTLIPLEELEYDCQKQIYNCLNLDFVIKMAIMPDAHTGFSVPIGSVILLDNVISPSYIGYDIGCGMCCIITDILGKDIDHRERVKIFNEILKTIPTGFSTRKHGLDYKKFQSASGDKQLNKDVNDKLCTQLGTLGGGNHYLEIGINLSGYITINIHSGSRKTGHLICTYYSNISNLEDKHLPNGFLDLNSSLGKSYLNDMLFAQEYALDNRKIMMESILSILDINPSRYMNKMINENHNHGIVLDNGLVLHRKGATPADKGQLGVIPGNMRDGVYITEGLGNEEYMSSSSHGAGRKLSRSKASSSLDFEKFKEHMRGIIAVVNRNILDESPDAYKNVEDVIKKQEGIVIKVIDKVTPIINIKADEESHRDRKKRKKDERRKTEKEIY